MALRLYNTLTRKKEEFEPLDPKKKVVKMYACGPTVYDYPHIGNYRAYLFEDLLRRYLEYRGYKVKMVMNITDVDDKTIAASGGNKAELKKLTTKYENDFMEGLKTLNV
ncbi:MAG: cysteine--tRNA ligase, partial [Candidatus Marinimicrobia bacterium]|nr:cysteine--tRNA ligase [Candidatus Neomarinimicrobiota bacterium]